MINYTERITELMYDIVTRVPALSYIDVSKVMVFARYGRADAEGAFATCHCLSLPPSEPGYYYWRDRETGVITRRSEWFVVKSPSVHIDARPIDYLISFTLPRFCNQTLERSRKEAYYEHVEPWIAKLDTIVHELYHIDPASNGIRTTETLDGRCSSLSHGPRFLERVAGMVKEYLRTKPDRERYDFLRYRFSDLTHRHGAVIATTFRTFPSFPQRYMEAMEAPPTAPVHVRIEPIKATNQPRQYTDADLCIRQFFEGPALAPHNGVQAPRATVRLQTATPDARTIAAACERKKAKGSGLRA
jgi:hypothetical protein